MNKKEIIDLAGQAEEMLGEYCLCRGLDIHGISHLRRVAVLSGRLALSVGEDVESVVVAGFLHDSARIDEGRGSRHAHDSAKLARILLGRFYPHLDADRICDAIDCHADGEVTTDMLAACLWDADRLELKRLGITVNPDLLSTRPAKRLARLRELNPCRFSRISFG